MEIGPGWHGWICTMSDHAWGVVTPVDHKDIVYERWLLANHGVTSLWSYNFNNYPSLVEDAPLAYTAYVKL